MIEYEADLLTKAIDQNRGSGVHGLLLAARQRDLQLVVLRQRAMLKVGGFGIPRYDRQRPALNVAGVEAGIKDAWGNRIASAVVDAAIVPQQSDPNQDGVPIGPVHRIAIGAVSLIGRPLGPIEDQVIGCGGCSAASLQDAPRTRGLPIGPSGRQLVL